MFKDTFFEHAAQVHGPWERSMEGKILKGDSVHITEVHVFHHKEGKPNLGEMERSILGLECCKNHCA